MPDRRFEWQELDGIVLEMKVKVSEDGTIYVAGYCRDDNTMYVMDIIKDGVSQWAKE